MTVRRPSNPLPARMTTGLVGRGLIAVSVLILSSCSPGAQADPLKPPLTDAGNIQLPKEAGKPVFDLLTLDPRNSHLYVPHTSLSTLDVIDVKARKLVGRVTGMGSIKAIALTKDPNIVYTSEAAGSVSVVDVPGLKVTQKLTLGGSPDAIEYDPVHDIVLVGLVTDKKVAFIDGTTTKLLGTVPLPGSPQLMTVDQKTGTVYLAIHDLNQVVEIDPVNRSIIKTLKGCDINAPTGLAYDPDQGLLFVANIANLSVIDVVIEQCRGGIDIGHGTDQIAFNRHLHHVYTADGGSRYVSVIDTVGLKPLGVFGTGPQAGTLAVDPTSDMVYVMVSRAGIIATYHDP
jgi:DNA-binding beta-propeller fold protein YncE